MPSVFVSQLNFYRRLRKVISKQELRDLRTRYRAHRMRSGISLMRELSECRNRNHPEGTPGAGLVASDALRYALACLPQAKQKQIALCGWCGSCATCCECRLCERCRNRTTLETSCPAFLAQGRNRCAGCCTCAKCYYCGNHFSGTRPQHECGVCKSCCVCERQVQFNVSKLFFHTASRAARLRNRSGRFISAEIEIAGVTSNAKSIGQKIQEWKGSVVSDGSLPSLGFEINTAPASGDLYLKQISEICAELQKGAADASKVCGLHVHVDARDFSYYDLRRLIYYYDTIEPILFAMVPHERRVNSFCNPCGERFVRALKVGRFDLKTVKKAVMSATYGSEKVAAGKVHEYRKDKYGAERYLAMNLGSWFYRGTVECRLHEGTADAEEIQNWGMLWANIMDFVVRSSDEQIQEMRAADEPRFYVARQNFSPATLTRKYQALQASIIKSDRLLKYVRNRINAYRYESVLNKTLVGVIDQADSLLTVPRSNHAVVVE